MAVVLRIVHAFLLHRMTCSTSTAYVARDAVGCAHNIRYCVPVNSVAQPVGIGHGPNELCTAKGQTIHICMYLKKNPTVLEGSQKHRFIDNLPRLSDFNLVEQLSGVVWMKPDAS